MWIMIASKLMNTEKENCGRIFESKNMRDQVSILQT